MAAQPAFSFASPAPEMPEPDGLSDEQLDALHAPQIRKPDPHALCVCGCPACYHHLLTGCSAGDGCHCRPCTGRAACKCTGFLSLDLVAQRRRDTLDCALEWAADARD